MDAFLTYWTSALLHPDQRDLASGRLETELRSVLHRRGIEDKRYGNLAALTNALPDLLRAEGFHALTGVTTPLYEFMLWRSERKETFEIPLPSGVESVEVIFLSDFVLRGWQAYATCGHYFSSGWTTPDKIFCMSDAYELNAEPFRISLLAHEGQHHLDLRRSPSMDQTELEYRAKLVELCLADTTLVNLLRAFSSQANADSTSPHARANHRVIRDLTFQLQRATKGMPALESLPSADIQKAARSLLEESSRTLLPRP
ncbi:MAG: hypothetical protein HYZ13_12300 [Acidobacteria bacterium]|nr:hypothetical protein [Acidobacteriota bacterium]